MFYFLEPEVAGQLGDETITGLLNDSPNVAEVHYIMDGFPSDDLLESFPCFILTDRLRAEVERSTLSGCTFGDARVSVSSQFEELHPGAEKLPPFSWLKVIGRPGVDDFGIAKDRRLVVSERALAVMRRAGNLSDCLIMPFGEEMNG